MSATRREQLLSVVAGDFFDDADTSTPLGKWLDSLAGPSIDRVEADLALDLAAAVEDRFREWVKAHVKC